MAEFGWAHGRMGAKPGKVPFEIGEGLRGRHNIPRILLQPRPAKIHVTRRSSLKTLSGRRYRQRHRHDRRPHGPLRPGDLIPHLPYVLIAKPTDALMVSASVTLLAL